MAGTVTTRVAGRTASAASDTAGRPDQQVHSNMNEEDRLRVHTYSILAALLSAPPSHDLLRSLRGVASESEGGGEESHSNPWPAELQQEMFCEINPKDANDNGVKDGAMVWIETPEGARVKVKAMFTRRVAPGVLRAPFHFGGWYEGVDLSDKYPEGSAPYIRGEAGNTAFTYGYDSVTQMQESKVSLCRVRAA